jgi:hypothetical protein
MKRLVAIAAIAFLPGLAACNSDGNEPTVTVNDRIAEAAFAVDEIYGVRHRASGAVCPGTIDGVPRIRAAIVTDQGPRYDWCQYTGRAFTQSFDIRIERKTGETAEAGLAALKASDLKDPDTWTEVAADFPDRQAKGFTWSKTGAVSHGIWISRGGEWRIALFADYPEAKRAEIIAAASDYFRKLRAQ